jgi:hypothetical protein
LIELPAAGISMVIKALSMVIPGKLYEFVRRKRQEIEELFIPV